MGTLTKSERDGLDEVFLSIHTSQDRFKKIKEISSLIISGSNKLSMKELIKQAKYGLKETKLEHFMTFLAQKKKNLSK